MNRPLLQAAAGPAPAVFPGLDPAAHRPHRLHAADRIWPETNCYVDLWIEVLAAMDLPPEAALGFTVAEDFEGDQFTFFKIPTEDLAALFGLRVQELAIFDAPEGHIAVQAARGRLVLMELDGFHLPDTRGVGYRTEHGKTTVAVNRIDLAARSMDYFHNGGVFTLSGEDFEGLFRTADRSEAAPFLPYAEFVKRPDRPVALAGLKDTATGLLRRHIGLRPAANPVRAFAATFEADVAALADRPFGAFHKYAFNTLRQLGANFELLADHLAWLGGPDDGIAAARAIADGAKAVQFQVARAVARRRVAGLAAGLAPIADHHDALMTTLTRRYG
ncbi:DUF1839 family protein [Mongoliimonas terrestris]|uniref:DUF1839 family protein n=1 Tax=Mongoliimonas terrestris TaxID=1709001 RepID=UPI0009495A4C|nr:DUF1839 family protein [Mongoliimonas terrestris]